MKGPLLTKALPLLATLMALGSAACGPMAENIPKALLHQQDDHSTPPSLLATDPSSTLANDEGQPIPVDETHFLSRQAFNRFVSDPVYRAVPANQRLEITDLSELRQENGSLSVSPSGFLSDDEDGKIIVVVEMNRPANAIPSRTYLPDARMSLSSEDGSVGAPVITLSFGDVEDPAADTTEELLGDATRIFIYHR